MIRSLDELLEAGARAPGATMAIAVGHDPGSLSLALRARQLLGVSSIVVGDRERAERAAEECGTDLRELAVVHEPDPRSAALVATRLAGSGEADMLVRGNITTADLLRVALRRDTGLRAGSIWSHVALIQLPDLPRLLMVTDGGVTIEPDLVQKAQILNNAVVVARALGIARPKVAVLAALERVNPAMQATVDAANLAKMADRGQLLEAVVDGPLALDNAISRDAARVKGIRSPVAGEADVLLAPDIETGSVLVRSLIFLAGGHIAGAVVGGRAPVIIPSASDLGGSNLESIALGKLLLA